jgi:CPA1 family monovalent cation:H+ antiporter
MDFEIELEPVEAAVALVAVAVFVALVVRRIAIPYTVALVILGLIAAEVLRDQHFEISPEVVLVVLLPGLLFDAAFRIDFGDLRKSIAGVVVLAAPGVVISAGVVAVILNLTTGLRFDLAFVIGAMVSATDPAAVLATFHSLGAPHRLANLVEGESLFNDGTGLVIFVLAIQAVQSDVTVTGAVVQFFATVAISILIGVVGGLVVSWIVSRVDDHLIETTISLALAYGTYVIADAFAQSGIIATVTAGIVLGNIGRRFGMSEKTREAIDTVWEFLAFLLTAVVFLLVGLAITLEDLLDAVGPILWGILAVLLGRALVVYLLLNGASRLGAFGGVGSRLPLSWLNVLWWSGLRGAVAVAMALSIPEDFPERALLQEVTFGVVLFTLLIQGTTIELLIARAEKIDV